MIGAMRIGLIDVDGKNFPNIPLMKLSAYHKQRGDSVEWYMPFNYRYDRVYMSKVFSFSEDFTDCINADEVIRGGTGYAIRNENGVEVYDSSCDEPLPKWVEHLYPDYSMYPTLTRDTAYGFLTRGCPRGCGFCHVGGKEGRRSVKVADLWQFWRGQRKIVLCDPNILACIEWPDLFRQLIESKAEIDFNQGIDIRLMSEKAASAIEKMRIKEIHFAWDRYEDKDLVLEKLNLFAERVPRIVGKAHKAGVYTIVNYDTTIEQDLERIYTLRDMGYWPYVMVYDRENAAQIYKDLQRWVNMRAVFASTPRFEDYNHSM